LVHFATMSQESMELGTDGATVLQKRPGSSSEQAHHLTYTVARHVQQPAPPFDAFVEPSIRLVMPCIVTNGVAVLPAHCCNVQRRKQAFSCAWM